MVFGNKRGFTLIELLVVISIISLLMAMLMPTLNRARKSAKQTVCLSNLRQWGIAYTAYLMDNDYRFPSQGFMWDNMYYQDEKLLFCPNATIPYDEGAKNPYGAWRGEGGKIGSYGVNNWCGDNRGQPLGGYKDALWITAQHKEAFNIPLYFDCYWMYATPLYDDSPPDYEGQIPIIEHSGGWGHNPDSMRSVCINRHNTGIGMVFVDASVRKVRLKELWSLRWHKLWVETMRNQAPPDWPEWMSGFKD